MGMHHGIISATSTLDDLLTELRGHTGELTPTGPVRPLDEVEVDAADAAGCARRPHRGGARARPRRLTAASCGCCEDLVQPSAVRPRR